MSDNKILDDINFLRSNIDVFGQNLSQEIAKLDDQIITSERENLELMEKALTLSKQIIKQHEVKSQLLGERQKMLTNISQQFNLVPATKVPDCGQNNSVVQQSSGQSQELILESGQRPSPIKVFDSTENNLAMMGGLSEEPEGASKDKVNPTIVATEGEPAWEKLISEGLEHFNLVRKQKIKTLEKMLPDKFSDIQLSTKLQVQGLGGQVLCSAGENEVLVLVTDEKLYAYFYRTGKLIEIKLETTVLCVELQSREVVLIGSDCGQLSLVSISEQHTELVHKYTSAVTAVKVHPNGGFVIAILASGEWSLVDVLDRKVLRTQDTHAIISGFDIHPNGAYLATCSYQGSITFWDLRLKSSVQLIQSDELFGIKNVKFLLQGNLLCLKTSTAIKILDTAKYPTGTISYPYSSSSASLLNVDPSGRILCCSTGPNVRIITTFRKEDGKRKTELSEIKSIELKGPVIYFMFVERGIIFLTAFGEIEMYKF